MTVDKANAIAKLGQVIVNSAKLEVDVIKMKHAMGDYWPGAGAFVESDDIQPKQLEGKKK